MIDREEPTWVSPELVAAIHERQLAEHGGRSGVRDAGLLESALSRPRHLNVYGGESVDIPALAASYAFGIARNHPFVDGNKRTAYVVCRVFLLLNGWDMVDSLVNRYRIFMRLAAGDLDEKDLILWLRDHARPNQVSEFRSSYVPT